jgi:hypothetical protein
MKNIKPYIQFDFVKAFDLMYCMYCKEYRKACEEEDEISMRIFGDSCTAFEDLAKVLGIEDLETRNPFEASPECCASCKHWDAIALLGNPDIEPWDELPEIERRVIAESGNCIKICESICPDQSCNYDLMNTEKTFYGNKYEKWGNVK